MHPLNPKADISGVISNSASIGEHTDSVLAVVRGVISGY